VLIGKATNTNVIVFGLTRPGLEPTIYRTRGEPTIHYTTDAVPNIFGFSSWGSQTGFPIFWPWAYLMKVIPDTPRVH